MKFAEPTAALTRKGAVGVSGLCEQLGGMQAAEGDYMKNGKKAGTGGQPRRQYDENYKRHAVDLTLRGDRTIAQVAQELGVNEAILYEWRRRFAPRPSGNLAAPQSLEEATQEIARLRGELVRMQERETVLKKSLGILSETPESGMPGSKR
jgi:transposase